MSLSAFLKQNVKQIENEKVIVSERFIDENGDVIPFEVRVLTNDEDEQIRKQCTYKKQIPGKKYQYMNETDYDKYVGMQAVACTVYPDLKDSSLQDSYGVMGELNLLKAMLTPGEYANYLGAVQKINGFDKDMEDIVDEAKN